MHDAKCNVGASIRTPASIPVLPWKRLACRHELDSALSRTEGNWHSYRGVNPHPCHHKWPNVESRVDVSAPNSQVTEAGHIQDVVRTVPGTFIVQNRDVLPSRRHNRERYICCPLIWSGGEHPIHAVHRRTTWRACNQDRKVTPVEARRTCNSMDSGYEEAHEERHTFSSKY